jgi:hypothetical protein
MSRKRKPFDAARQRLRGTEAAAFQRSARAREQRRVAMVGGKPKYRVEHENLVTALRAARRIAAYQDAAARGRARGPPPPMPVLQDVPDGRVECRVCHKRFGAEQYERHVRTGYCTPNATGMAPRASRGGPPPRAAPAPARAMPRRPPLGRR